MPRRLVPMTTETVEMVRRPDQGQVVEVQFGPGHDCGRLTRYSESETNRLAPVCSANLIHTRPALACPCVVWGDSHGVAWLI